MRLEFISPVRRGLILHWLRECWDRGGMPGPTLVDAIGAAHARDLLAHWEADGWIVRGKYEPTRSMRFFCSPGTQAPDPESVYAQGCYFWAPNRSCIEYAELLFPRRGEAISAHYRLTSPTDHD